MKTFKEERNSKKKTHLPGDDQRSGGNQWRQHSEDRCRRINMFMGCFRCVLLPPLYFFFTFIYYFVRSSVIAFVLAEAIESYVTGEAQVCVTFFDPKGR